MPLATAQNLTRPGKACWAMSAQFGRRTIVDRVRCARRWITPCATRSSLPEITPSQLASPLNVSRNLWVDGTGRNIAISGDTTGDGTGDVRPFNITGSVVVTFTQISIVKGYVVGEGGGVYLGSGGKLTAQNCTFLGNSTASPSDSGSYGGAIANYGTLIVTGSTFSGNSVTGSGEFTYAGGAIFNANTLAITDSTLSGNSSVNWAAASTMEETARRQRSA